MYPIETIFSSGATLYAIIHNPDGTIWRYDTSVWEAYNAAHWVNYAIPLIEQGAGYYSAAYPTDIEGVLTSEVVYQQAGGTPALIDAPATGIAQTQGVDVASVAGSVEAATRLGKSLSMMKRGTVLNTGTSTVAKIFTDLTGTEVNAYQGRNIGFLSGVLKDQVGNITAFDPIEHSVTVGGPFTQAPGVADTFIIV